MCFSRVAMSPGDSLPTDPDALRTLLLAERERHAEELERLAAIIKELQRHSFRPPRRAAVDPEQLALALEDVRADARGGERRSGERQHRPEASHAA